jgi:tetratricopeptide (TPR) repeat protein
MIKANPEDPKGYYLKARLLVRDIEDEENKGAATDNAQKKYEEAFNLISNGLESSPNDQDLLRLKSLLFEKLYPNDIKGRYDTLMKRLKAIEAAGEICSDLKLLFQLGVACFQLEKYTDARKYFNILGDRSGGHPLRRGVIEKSIDSASGKPKLFTGVINQFKTHKEAYIHSSTMGWIEFDPRAQKREFKLHDHVEFHIVFNYRGMLAFNLRR